MFLLVTFAKRCNFWGMQWKLHLMAPWLHRVQLSAMGFLTHEIKIAYIKSVRYFFVCYRRFHAILNACVENCMLLQRCTAGFSCSFPFNTFCVLCTNRDSEKKRQRTKTYKKRNWPSFITACSINYALNDQQRTWIITTARHYFWMIANIHS